MSAISTVWFFRNLGDDDDADDIAIPPPPDAATDGDEQTIEDAASHTFPESNRAAIAEQKLNEEISNMSVSFFLFSVVWSLGGTLDKASRLKFDEFFRGVTETESQNCKYPRYSSTEVVFSSLLIHLRFHTCP